MHKVDNAIRLHTSMTDRRLLKFIIKKVQKEPEVPFLRIPIFPTSLLIVNPSHLLQSLLCYHSTVSQISTLQRIVISNNEHRLTLRQVFDLLGVSIDNFTLDSLNVDVRYSSNFVLSIPLYKPKKYYKKRKRTHLNFFPLRSSQTLATHTRQELDISNCNQYV